MAVHDTSRPDSFPLKNDPTAHPKDEESAIDAVFGQLAEPELEELEQTLQDLNDLLDRCVPKWQGLTQSERVGAAIEILVRW